MAQKDKMNRRKFLTSTVVFPLAGCLGGNNNSSNRRENTENNTDERSRVKEVSDDKVPERVLQFKAVATFVSRKVKEHFSNVRTFINREGEIFLQYESDASTQSELKTEMNQIIEIYLEFISSKSQATTFSVINGKVQSIVTKPVVASYVKGNLKKSAVLETIEVMSVERNDG